MFLNMSDGIDVGVTVKDEKRAGLGLVAPRFLFCAS